MPTLIDNLYRSPAQRRVARRIACLAVALMLVLIALAVAFPGRQGTMALTVATGIGVETLQGRIDALEERAIRRQAFTDDDKAFLRDLYTCLARGAKMSIAMRQSAQMMERYLSGTGKDLELAPRIFILSGPVREEMDRIQRRIGSDHNRHKGLAKAYKSAPFCMSDPHYFESAAGLYVGTLTVRPERKKDGTILLHCRAEVPWHWPSYASLKARYNDYHAECFRLPNLRSLVLGPQESVSIDNGLGEHLTRLGLAKPFLAYGEWTEPLRPVL